MKLYPSKVINKLDVATIHLGTPQLELIHIACYAFIQFILPKIDKTQNIVCLCGMGNNGIDGLFIAKKLNARGYQVKVLCIDNRAKQSNLYRETKSELKACRIPLLSIHPSEGIDKMKDADILIDGIFGNGLNRPLSDVYLKLIDNINGLNKTIYAIDIPSGMRAEGEIDEIILRCAATLAFQYPKLSFFQREAAPFLGNWDFRSIGIPPLIIKKEPSNQFLIDRKFIHSILKTRNPHSHKGSYGHTWLIGGSEGMAGAIILSAISSLKIGTGRCTIISSEENRETCQVNIPEATFKSHDPSVEELKQHSVGIGPGLGKSIGAKKLLTKVIRNSVKPIVLDADALNLLAENPVLFDELPPNSILTPHTGEFHTLYGSHATDFQRLTTQREEAKKRSIFIVLKGKYTSIACPDGSIYFNTTGNPGMATGGSGDVLTGLLTGLLAQHFTPKEAAILGVYIHGLSGDIAKNNIGEMSLIASDIISNIPGAIMEIRKETK